MKGDIQVIQRHLLRSPLDPARYYPNFWDFLKAKWREDPKFAHKWKLLWVKRVKGLEKPSKRKEKYEVPPKPEPPPVTLPRVPKKRTSRKTSPMAAKTSSHGGKEDIKM